MQQQNEAQERDTAFVQCLNDIVFPAYDDFVREMVDMGLDARKDSGIDGYGQRYADVAVRVDGGSLAANASENSVYRVKLLTTGHIELISFSDMRVQHIKPAKATVGLSDITAEFIEGALAAFLTVSLNSRKKA
ncbi:hypothetical protein WI57_29970 [Burkholderia cepacia]|nr:hypothetical protein WI57_29970 [Burkholderia cepacia]KVB87830.1 hypothetical protein WI65_25905 [Burkholderia cepacia]KVB98126.1 hypothetical protein WI66_11895 [Burkholderia cepacia]